MQQEDPTSCRICGGLLRADNRTGLCKRTPKCRQARAALYYESDSKQILERQRERYRTDSSKALATCATYRKNNREVIRSRKRDTAYGLEPGQYKRMFDAQGGRCLGCGGSDKPLHVDHDHACCPKTPTEGDCNRGLLCDRCNRALGLLEDNPATLAALITYLLNWKKTEGRTDA